MKLPVSICPSTAGSTGDFATSVRKARSTLERAFDSAVCATGIASVPLSSRASIFPRTLTTRPEEDDDTDPGDQPPFVLVRSDWAKSMNRDTACVILSIDPSFHKE